MKKLYLIAILTGLTAPAVSADENPADFGTTNPDEMTWQRFAERAEDGETDMVLCSMGYAMTKSGDHATARLLFENCANAGYTGAMTWMSQMDNNGLGGEYSPDASAEWDRLAAEAGDPVGKFNHGLNLMRGHGIARNEALARQMIDEAARDGLPVAQRLQAADYDIETVTPDADNWKYAPVF